MIALDTGLLIYGTQAARHRRGHYSEIQLAIIPRAVNVLSELEAEGEQVIVPAPAAWEYVLDFSLNEQARIWRAFGGFSIAPFDLGAARIAAEISRRYFDRVVESAKGTGKRQALAAGARQQIKVDIQILAIAIAQRADAIYTLEVERFSEWAAGEIRVIGLPAAMSA